MGYLYIMGTEEGLIKIGQTEQRVEERRKALQTGCPFEITKVWHSEDIPGYQKCERIMHAMYADQKTQGEWFRADFKGAVFAADKVCRENAESDEMRQIRYLWERLGKLETQVHELKHGKVHLPTLS